MASPAPSPAPLGLSESVRAVFAQLETDPKLVGKGLSAAFGGWGPKSQVPERRYIDPMCPRSDAGRRFSGWLVEL